MILFSFIYIQYIVKHICFGYFHPMNVTIVPMIRINNFRCDTTDVSDITKTLEPILPHTFCLFSGISPLSLQDPVNILFKVKLKKTPLDS